MSADIPSHQRELLNTIEHSKDRSNCWVANGTKETLRDDYNELATLALLFLGDATNDNQQTTATIYAPGALHRARWMAKCSGAASPKFRGGQNFIGFSSGAPRIRQRGCSNRGCGGEAPSHRRLRRSGGRAPTDF